MVTIFCAKNLPASLIPIRTEKTTLLSGPVPVWEIATYSSPKLHRFSYQSVKRLCLLPLAFFLFCGAFLNAKIDRQELVRRHNPVIHSVDPESAVSLGNGDFAMTVDVTGLQSMPDYYFQNGLPLETLSTWAWHSFENEDSLSIADSNKAYPFYGREIEFPALQSSPAGAYFRANPHPVAMGQIGLLLDGALINPTLLTAIDQRLDLWTGVLVSRFELEGKPVVVKTAVGSDASTVGVVIDSVLLEQRRLSVQLAFPLSYKVNAKNKPEMIWDAPEAHETVLVDASSGEWQLRRSTLGAVYSVHVKAGLEDSLKEIKPHHWGLGAVQGSRTLKFSLEFVSGSGAITPVPDASLVFQNSTEGWERYWNEGGMVQLHNSKDPRAQELERRIVLSQYLMRVNYAGSFPPAEGGLAHITWFGKHHSEMYFWHSAHWYIWGRTQYLEKSLEWYRKVLGGGKDVAKSQGFEGVRWPKMSGIDGRPSPGTINPFIIWNQPNPIYLCELVYRNNPTEAVLEHYRDMVFASADFLASYAQKDPETGTYNLGPPIKAVTESTSENQTRNPSFELAYWRFALEVAQKWRVRLGMEPQPTWQEVMDRLTPLPMEDGKYLEIETFRGIFNDDQFDPYSMIMALGYVPQTEMVDASVMLRTFEAVTDSHPLGMGRWDSWSMSAAALTCTRLQQPELAVQLLANESKTVRFMLTGYVRRPKEPEGCVAYLPVNASFLNAVGMMAGGWYGAPERTAPGFPDTPQWVVEVEGMNAMP